MKRSPVVAGQFYTANPTALREEVSTYLTAGQPSREAPTLLAMAPHAGYLYSGAVAGLTLGKANLPDTIILLGPNHTGRGAPISVWSGDAWKTPLGDMPVESELASCLVKSDPIFTPDMEAHLGEHSLEVLLPFLQVANPNTRIVPVAIATPDPEVLARTGAAIARCISDYGDPVAMVVSTDMSHYISHDEATLRDQYALDAIQSADPEGLYNTVREQNISMCGVLPMTAALVACRLLGVKRTSITAYRTSGEVSGDMSQVVGYAGALADRTPTEPGAVFG